MIAIPFNEMTDKEFEQFKKEFDLSKWNEYKQNMENIIEILSMNIITKEIKTDKKTEKKGILKRWL